MSDIFKLLSQIAQHMPQTNYIPKQDITELEKLMIMEDGSIRPILFRETARFTQEQISTFCVLYGLYQFPTIELILWLRNEIGDLSEAIEIGAGNGCIGRSVGVRMYDSKVQEEPEMRAHYQSLGQPIITYGKDVIKMDGLAAIIATRPKVVLGCWITGKKKGGVRISDVVGVEEERMFKHGVTKYIHVGNLNTHLTKPIMQKANGLGVNVTTVYQPWLVTRSLNYDRNIIHVFTKK